MITRTDVIEVFIATTLLSYFLAPVLAKIAFTTGYLDHPKSNKVHAHPTPLLGGLAIYLAFIVGLIMTSGFNEIHRFYSIFAGSTLLLIIGLVDDRMGMMPELKLLAQVLAAMVVVKSGVRIEFMDNYYIGLILTYIWIVGITNSFNLLDNMNGLSAGIAVIAAAFFGVIMWTSHQLEMAFVSFALAGSCLGFLKNNFPRARIFMGDTGSLVIGFTLSVVAIMGSWSTRFLTTSLAMPVIILAYPIFDTTLVTVMRIREGRSIFQGGKDHSSHRLALLGLKKKRAVLVIYGICIALGLSAIVIQRVSLKSAIAVMALVLASMFALGVRLSVVKSTRVGRKKGKALI